MSKTEWHDKIKSYCDKYNIPLYYLSDTLDEPKVTPMIRGKAFEFTVCERIKSILNPEIWDVEKLTLNPQLGSHDIDVQVIHKETNKILRIECKLAKKGSCKVEGDHTKINVKCMRSRTLGEEIIKMLSPKLGIPESILKVHNDQYLESDFDFVVTSIGNAFYQTSANDSFIFSPKPNQIKFLENFPGKNLKDETFNYLYIARSKEISIHPENKVICTRRKCENKENCGFIPNYPDIMFKTSSLAPINNWHKIEKANEIFMSFIEL